MTRNPLLAWAENPQVLDVPVRVPEGLRGWNIDLGDDAYEHLMSMSVAVTDCPTGRIAYLEANGFLTMDKRFARAARKGKVIHKAVELAQKHAAVGKMDVRVLLDAVHEFEPTSSETNLAVLIYRTFFHIFSAVRTRALAILLSEQALSGRVFGLSNVRFDLLVGQPPIVVDFKTGKVRREHLLQVTGYALLYEHHGETPVNYGGIWSIDPGNGSHSLYLFQISSKLRRIFLERVAQKLPVLKNPKKDPGMADDSHCSRCFWQRICRAQDNQEVNRRP